MYYCAPLPHLTLASEPCQQLNVLITLVYKIILSVGLVLVFIFTWLINRVTSCLVDSVD